MAQKKTPTKRTPKGMQNYEMPDKEISSAIMKFNSIIYKKGKTKPKDADELKERFEFFFNLCAETGLSPTIEGLAIVSGYDIRSIWDIEHGRGRSDFSEIVKEAKFMVQNYDAMMARNRIDSNRSLYI